jgi:hypothetical protein
VQNVKIKYSTRERGSVKAKKMRMKENKFLAKIGLDLLLARSTFAEQ